MRIELAPKTPKMFRKRTCAFIYPGLLFFVLRPFAGGCCLLAVVYCLLAVGYWLLAIGYWLLAIGYWLLAN
jgi:hypothetical protein